MVGPKEGVPTIFKIMYKTGIVKSITLNQSKNVLKMWKKSWLSKLINWESKLYCDGGLWG